MKTVWLTGAAGFIGGRLRARLQMRADLRLVCSDRDNIDLADEDAVCALVDRERPDVAVHLAAVTAGSVAMRREPVRFFAENLASALPLLRLLEQGRLARVVMAGSAGEYPRLIALGETPRGLRPADLWRGPACGGGYGLARRTISTLLLDAAREADVGAAVLVFPTIYGPGDGGPGPLQPERMRALPAFALRMLAARATGADEVHHHGTGHEERDLLHVDDAAAALEAALTGCVDGERVHVTAGEPLTMASLANQVAAAVGYTGRHVWDDPQERSDDRVWLAPAGLDALAFHPRRTLAGTLPEVVADLRARVQGAGLTPCAPQATVRAQQERTR